MARTDADYLEELGLHLRLAGMDGDQIGAVLEEAHDHLVSSGEGPEDAFGTAEVYAAALARSRGSSSRAMNLTRGDLVAAAAQLLGWILLVYGIAALGGPDGVEIVPGHVAGLVVLTLGLVWPVWPMMRSYMARRIGFVVPWLAMMGVIATFVGLMLLWDAPVLLTLAAWPAVVMGVAVIAGCWSRAWRLRDPVRRPGEAAHDPGS